MVPAMKQRIIAFILLLATAAQAAAVPILYTETFIASGTFDGVDYVDRLVTLSLSGDTTTKTALTPNVDSVTGFMTVVVDGFGTATFTGDTRAVVNRSFQAAGGLSDFTSNRAILFTANHATFSTWDLITPIGPVTGGASFNVGFVHPTTLPGGFSIDSVSGQSTFTARLVDVPEPATLSLLGLALGIAAFRRRAS
jgi:hypothetical protein